MSAQAIADHLTPALVLEAIRDGEEGKVPSGLVRVRRGDAFAVFTTPFMRVADAARRAKREFRTFSAGDTSVEMVAPVLQVYADPMTAGARVFDVTAIVVTPRKGSKQDKFARAIHPTSMERVGVEYRNLAGAQLQGSGTLALFPLSVLSGDNELQVVYENGRTRTGRFELKGVR